MKKKDIREALRQIAMAEMQLEDIIEKNDSIKLRNIMVRLRVAVNLLRPFRKITGGE